MLIRSINTNSQIDYTPKPNIIHTLIKTPCTMINTPFNTTDMFLQTTFTHYSDSCFSKSCCTPVSHSIVKKK